jgi:hypothetical protein
MGNGVSQLHESTGLMKKTLTETQNEAKTTYFYISSSMEAFLGDLAF